MLRHESGANVTWPRLDRRTGWIVFALVAYGVFALCCFAPFGLFDRGYLPRAGLGDPAQMAWFLAYTPHAVAHGLNLFHTNLIDYPTGVNLADNTSVPLLGLISAPVTAVGGPVAAFNLLLRAALFVSALSMFFALRRWCRSWASCFIGGLCFGFGPYVIDQSQYNAHINLAFVPFVPLFAWCIDELFVSRRYRPVRIGALLGISVAGQLLIAPEILSDCGLVAGIVVFALALCNREAVRNNWRHVLTGAAVAAGVFVLVGAYPVFEMLKSAGHLSGPVDGVNHLQSFRNDLVEMLLPTARQFFAPTALVHALHLPTRDVNETGGYISVPLVIATLAALVMWWRERLLRVLGLAGAVALVLSLGSRLSINGHLSQFPLPEAVLAHLPLFDNTVPDRFALIGAFATAAIFAVGIDRSLEAARGLRHGPQVVSQFFVVVGVAVVVVSLAPRLPITESPLLWPAGVPKLFASNTPGGSVVLTYPYPTPPYNEVMLFQADEGFPYRLMGGYATIRGPRGVGQDWPLLLAPNAIEEFLGRAEAGPRSHYPAPAGPVTPSIVCSYVSRYGISSVMVWMGAVNSAEVAHVFASALGTPKDLSGQVEAFTVGRVVTTPTGATHC